VFGSRKIWQPWVGHPKIFLKKITANISQTDHSLSLSVHKPSKESKE
jgi:hypothetical protein